MGATKAKRKSKSSDAGVLDQIAEWLLPSEEPLQIAKSELASKFVGCFLCKRSLDVRLSKKGRPYLVCDNCGVQVFVRGRKEIERLREHVREEP